MFFAIALEDEPFASKDKSHLSLKKRGWWEKEFAKACLPSKGRLSIRIARKLGEIRPAGHIPFPTLREGLFVLVNPKRSQETSQP